MIKLPSKNVIRTSSALLAVLFKCFLDQITVATFKKKKKVTQTRAKWGRRDGEKEEEGDRPRERGGKASRDRGSTLYFRLPHNWNSIYWDLCVPLSLHSHHISFRLSATSHVWHTPYNLNTAGGGRRGSCVILFFWEMPESLFWCLEKELTMSGSAQRGEGRGRASGAEPWMFIKQL